MPSRACTRKSDGSTLDKSLGTGIKAFSQARISRQSLQATRSCKAGTRARKAVNDSPSGSKEAKTTSPGPDSFRRTVVSPGRAESPLHCRWRWRTESRYPRGKEASGSNLKIHAMISPGSMRPSPKPQKSGMSGPKPGGSGRSSKQTRVVSAVSGMEYKRFHLASDGWKVHLNFPKQKKTSVGDTAARRGTIPLQRPDQLLMYLASAWVSAGSASVIDQISKVGLRVSRFCPFGRFGG